MTEISSKHGTRWREIPSGIWALGFVSMFMDISSEMIHATLPLYLVVALGAPALTVGAIEGAAEATALITKIFSGALSDWLGRHKFLAAFGTGWLPSRSPSCREWLMVARFVDRAKVFGCPARCPSCRL
jgi:hypothetical protein